MKPQMEASMPDVRSEASFSDVRADADKGAVKRTAAQDWGKKVEEKTIAVIQEDLAVTKREIETGGVHVETHVVAQPVQRHITLREERIVVERRPVDRFIEGSEVRFEGDSTIEMIQHAEEAVVSKRARVVEEVVLLREVRDRIDTINDTLRHTEVDVRALDIANMRAFDRDLEHATENLRDEEGEVAATAESAPAFPPPPVVANELTASRASGFDDYEAEYRRHYESMGGKPYDYDKVAAAYRYGHNLGLSSRYAGRDWTGIEREVRGPWEERNPGTWDQIKGPIFHAWSMVSTKH